MKDGKVYRARSLKELGPMPLFNKEKLAKIMGTPWSPTGVITEKSQSLRRAPPVEEPTEVPEASGFPVPRAFKLTKPIQKNMDILKDVPVVD